MEMLVKSNLRFVVNIANLYKGQGIDVGELISEGNMGLMEAARRFDPNQKIKFISYAVWWVRQNITRAIAEKGRMVRISAEKELVLRRFNKKGGKLRQVIGGNYVLDPDSLTGVSKYKADAIEKIVMMGNYIVKLRAHYDYVPDPYYEGAEGFELALDLLEDACGNLLNEILQNKQ